jgi:rRNA-processing protein EBP2
MARQSVTPTKSSDHRPKAEKKIRPEQKLPKLVEPPPMDNSDVSESEGDEGSGVDDEGLEKLVRALGEDGLDEFDRTQLRMLVGSPVGEEEEEEEDDDADHHAESTTGSEEEKQADGEEAEEGIALDDEDIDSVDEDAIPRRKIEVDNKVRVLLLPRSITCLNFMNRSRSNAYGTPSSWTHHFHGPKRWWSHSPRQLTSTLTTT